jgi:hypothetical protein
MTDCAVFCRNSAVAGTVETSFVYNGYLLLTSSDPITLVLPWLLLQEWLRSANPVLWCDQRRCSVQLGRAISVSRDGRLKTTERHPAEFVATGSAVRITRKLVSKREEISEQSWEREGRKSEKVWLPEVQPPVCHHCFKRPIQNEGDLLQPRVFCVNVYKVKSWNVSPTGIIQHIRQHYSRLNTTARQNHHLSIQWKAAFYLPFPHG